MQEQSTHVRYTIDDGTGSIEVSKWAENKEGAEDDDEAAKRESFTWVFVYSHILKHSREGAYVKVIGPIRVFQGKKTIHAHHIALVENMDELTYHQLLCTYVHLYLTRGPAVVCIHFKIEPLREP